MSSMISLKRDLRSYPRFFKSWLRAPLKMGAFIPSSRNLAESMVGQIDLEQAGHIIELGAGTGVMTRALLAHGIAAERIVVVERDRSMVAMLSKQFPGLDIVHGDACHLDTILRERKVRKVSAIISSLPLLSLPKKIREPIEQHMARAIGTQGRIIQFSYRPRSPIEPHRLHQLGLKAQRVKTVLGNVPPAHIFTYHLV